MCTCNYIYMHGNIVWLQGRDITIAFSLVALTYIFIGSVFYLAFPLPKYCIEDVSK